MSPRWANRAAALRAPPCCCRTLTNRIPGLSINRFCASGMEAVNLAANQVRAGAGQAYIAGGVEMMGRVAMGSDGAAIAVDPSLAMKTYFVPQGISAPTSSRPNTASPATTPTRWPWKASAARPQAWEDGRFADSVVTIHDQNGLPILSHDEYMRPGTDMQTPRRAEGQLQGHGRADARLRQGRPDEVPASGADQPHPPCRQLQRHRRWRRRHPDRQQGIRRGARPETPRPHPRHRQDRHRSHDHADRPGAGDREDPARQRHGDLATSTCSR